MTGTYRYVSHRCLQQFNNYGNILDITTYRLHNAALDDCKCRILGLTVKCLKPNVCTPCGCGKHSNKKQNYRHCFHKEIRPRYTDQLGGSSTN